MSLLSDLFNRRTLTFAVAAVLVSPCLVSACHAQEVAFLDFTKIAMHVDLRRPKATSPVTAGRAGAQQMIACRDSAHPAGSLRTSLVSLDRTSYVVGDEPVFEVTIENTGADPVSIPFSPQLADLQPQDPAKQFAYYELQVAIWIAGENWGTDTGGRVALYGDSDHANTMVTLRPGEWVRVTGRGRLTLGDQLVKLSLSGQPADRVYAQASLYRQETLLTPTQSATAGREICLVQMQGRGAPIQLTIP
jgi:hypothetical protein